MQSDIEFSGNMGLYQLLANTQAGLEFILANVAFDEWQGTIEDGITIEDTRNAQDITDGAFDAGISVAVNGRRYIGNGRVEVSA